jgi:uncharacterized membrane protein (UPF0127 family)
MRTAILCILLLIGCGQGRGQSQYATPRAQVGFPDGTRVSVEVADTDDERARGLMFRDRLPQNEGMVFIFETPGFYPFWMQNCLIALDLIWLDPAARVVSVAESVPPCRFADCPPPCASPQCPTYPPAAGTSALYVVEVAAGFAKQHKVKVGDQLTFRGLPKNKSAAGRY